MKFTDKIKRAKKEILSNSKDSVFIVAYSGGKDSSVALDLLLKTVKENNIKNDIYILISRTKSEYPEFETYLNNALSDLKKYLKKENINNVKIIEGEPDETKRFLFLIIGKGYPVPRNNMRWCTLQMKIKTAEKIEREIKKGHQGLKPVKIIGTRKEEGTRRAQKIDKYHSNVANGILSLMPIRDFSTEDIWRYVDKKLSFNKQRLLKLYNNINLDSSNSLRQGCWFCPLIQTDYFLKNNYPSVERYRKFLKGYMLAPGTRYQISRDFTKETAGPYKMHIREKFFKELVKELSQIKNPFEFISKKEIINIQKEHIKEGWLTLNILKDYLKLNKDKNIKSFITSVDSINVLFSRFKAIKEHELFENIKVSDFCIGAAKRILLKENMIYGYKLKTIDTPAEYLKVPKELKKEYLILAQKIKKTNNPLKKDMLKLSLKIMHNYLYYLHKFTPLLNK